MSDWTLLNKARVRDGLWRSEPRHGFNGAFSLKINGLRVNVIASDGLGWRHVSVSLHGSTFTPSWEIMCKVKDLFWEPDDWVVQFHPGQSDYVNNHPGCLHLWQPTNVPLPKPDPVMVGCRNQTDIDRINSFENVFKIEAANDDQQTK